MTNNWGQICKGYTYDYDAGKITGDMVVDDLARSLAGINRYNAWQDGSYWSVASHSCLVAEIIAAQADYPPIAMFGGLHDDDHEALVGDAIAPFKAAMSPAMQSEWTYHATKAQGAIARRLGIWRHLPDALDVAALAVIKAADLAALEAERLWLFHVKLTWATEQIVSPKMLEAGQRILAGDFGRITGGPEAAARFVSHHNALLARMGVA